MALRSTYATEGDIPEDVRDLYVDDGDGVWYFDMTGVEEHPVIGARVRAKRRATKERNEAARAAANAQANLKVLDVDRASFEKALHVVQRVAKEVAAKDAGLGEVIKVKDAKIVELEAGVKTVGAELTAVRIDGAIRPVALELGASGDTMFDVLARADEFEVEDGAVVRQDGKSVSEWLDDLKEEAPHLFTRPPSTGGGIHPSPALHGSREAVGAIRPNNRGGDPFDLIAAIASGDFIRRE